MGKVDRPVRTKKAKVVFTPSPRNTRSRSNSLITTKLDMKNFVQQSPSCSPPVAKKPEVNLTSPGSAVITEDDIERMIGEFPDSGDGILSKKFVTLIRMALVKDFEEILDTRISALKAGNEELKGKLIELKKQHKNDVVQLETDINRLEQYGRRSNVEISGIPDEVSDAHLEDKIMEILGEINVRVEPKEVEACHRLPQGRFSKGLKRTVIRFTNRKICDVIHRNKKKLKNVDKKKLCLKDNVYVNYSLCRDYRKLWYYARKLNHDGKIARFWVSNGTIKVGVTLESPPISILHRRNFEEMFPGYDLDGPLRK